MLEEVLSELNLTQKSLENGVTYLKEWLNQQSHLPNFTDEDMIKSFIMGSKSIERAKKRLNNYFSSRAKYPKFFAIRDPSLIQWDRVGKLYFLPKCAPNNISVVFGKIPSGKEIKKFDFEESVKAWLMILDHEIWKGAFVSGQINMFDFKGLNMELVLKYYPSILAAIVSIYQNAYPIRMKAMIWFNIPPMATMLVKSVKMVLNDKLKNRFFVYSEDHSILEKYVPMEILPEDYGGKEATHDKLFDKTINALIKDKDWFMTNGTLSADEAKRKEDINNPQKFQGTFRRLQID